jgi:hypothetical protein
MTHVSAIRFSATGINPNPIDVRVKLRLPAGAEFASVMHRNPIGVPFGSQRIADVVNLTETSGPHAHCFLASQPAPGAEARAQKPGHLLQD